MSNKSDLTRPNQPFEKFIAERVKQLRMAKKMTTLQFAKILGINERQVYKHESGTFWISAGRLLLISKALDVPITYFYNGFSNRYVAKILTNSLGFRLKSARLGKGLSAKEAGRKLGVSYQQMYTYENDIVKPTLSTAIKMTQLYDIDITEFSDLGKEEVKAIEPVSNEKQISKDLDGLLFCEKKDHGELIGKAIDESKEGWSFKSTYKFLKNKIKG